MSEYFQHLNYTLANEDSEFEVKVLPPKLNSVVAVNGSGARGLALLCQEPANLTLIDISKEQLWLTELKIQSYLKLDYEEYLFFWGLPPYSAESDQKRKALLETFELRAEVRRYFLRLFEQVNDESLLYQGRWEKTFIKLSKINRLMTQGAAEGLFDCQSQEEQKKFLKEKFPWKRWNLVVRMLGSATLFNALLYKGHFPKANLEKDMTKFYLNSFDKLFREGLARDNFFLELCFLGGIKHVEAIPFESKPESFARIKKALSKSKIHLVQGDLIENLKKSTYLHDFISLSDVPSYFVSPREQTFMQEIKSCLQAGASVVLRSYRHRPENMDLRGYTDVTDGSRELIRKEKVGVYHIEIFQKSY